jgi:cysteinyl-tRNA synthetase
VTEDGEGRIEAVEGKRNAADFAIWRKTPPGESRQMEWDSPWGRGAPGWHLECSVMSGEVLGFPFDIHTGGIDHREIHHPNEIAQNQAFAARNGLAIRKFGREASGCTTTSWSNAQGKMSKSSGEFLRLQLLIDKGYHPLAYRLMCLQAHYRSELEFSWEGLSAALTRLKRMVMAVAQLRSMDELPADPDGGDSWTRRGACRWGAAAAAGGVRQGDFRRSQFPACADRVGGCAGAKKVERKHKWQMLAEMDAVLGLGVLGLDPRRPAHPSEGSHHHRSRNRNRARPPQGSARRQGLRHLRCDARRTRARKASR